MASTTKALPSLEEFERAAQEYAASLTEEDYMESSDQHTQISITDVSLGLVTRRRPELQCVGDMLVQYMHDDRIARVVPDNLIVLSSVKIERRGSLSLPYENLQLILAAEYVSEGGKRKDYEESFTKCEQQLHVPYYLTFDPAKQDLRLHVLEGSTYVPVEPNTDGRLAIERLDLEVALREGWARWWYKGKLLAIPAELEDSLKRKAKETRRQRKLRKEAEQRAVLEKQRAEKAHQRAEKANQRAEEAHQRAEQEKQRADQMQAELAQLRAQLQGRKDAGDLPPS